MSSPATVVIPQGPPTGRRPDRRPLYRTMGFTLDISSRFLLSALMGKGSVDRVDSLLRGYADRIFRSGNAQLLATGLERLEPGAAYVYMSNHRSLLDIPSIFAAVPGSVRMVFKQELLRVPVWGPALKGSGFIPIDRKNTARAIEQLETAKERLLQGVSVWIAPEGTRSRTGELGPFKKGGFHLARQLGLPIVPVWIEGTSDIIPPDQFIANYDGSATVHFGEPLDPLAHADVASLMEDVRARMLALDEGAERPEPVIAEERPAGAGKRTQGAAP